MAVEREVVLVAIGITSVAGLISVCCFCAFLLVSSHVRFRCSPSECRAVGANCIPTILLVAALCSGIWVDIPYGIASSISIVSWQASGLMLTQTSILTGRSKGKPSILLLGIGAGSLALGCLNVPLWLIAAKCVFRLEI